MGVLEARASFMRDKTLYAMPREHAAQIIGQALHVLGVLQLAKLTACLSVAD